MKQPSQTGAATKRHVILFLAANPPGTLRLSLDEEAHSVHVELRRSGYRDRFDFVTRWATEPLDLLRELREMKPTVVHFAGHGGGVSRRRPRTTAMSSRRPDRSPRPLVCTSIAPQVVCSW